MSDIAEQYRRGHGQQLSRTWDRAIAALLQHSRITDAARSIKVNPETLRRWLSVPEFADAYASARKEVLEETVSALRLASSEAVRTLTRNMRCGIPAAEIMAARAILDSVLKPAGVQVESGQTPIKIELVYAPQVNIDATNN